MHEQLKIFISAYACEPEKGSEPGIGWNVVNELAKYHEVHVLTRSNNREPIEAALSGLSALSGKTENLPVFHYYDVPKWLSFWKKKRRGYHLYYYLWQYGAYFKYRKFVNTFGFDLVQHLTFANFSMPSLFMFCKPLTVWGPIGIIPIPRNVQSALPFKIRLKEWLRWMTMQFLCRLEPVRLLTPYKADYLIDYAENPQSSFPEKWHRKVLKHSQTGINPDEAEYAIVSHRGADGKIHLLICSEFIHWKGCVFSAEAAVPLLKNNPETVLDIYGSGPEKEKMKRFLSVPELADRIHWHGFVSKTEMLQALADSDILLYPSYHHGLATVILQAMYFKLPIIALEGDPVAQTVKLGCGLTASGHGKEEIIGSIVKETEKLIKDPELRQRLGEKGRELIGTHYDWRVLCKELDGIFRKMVQAKGCSPCL